MKTLQELQEIITSKGLAFEKLHDQANWINGFRTAEKIYKGNTMRATDAEIEAVFASSDRSFFSKDKMKLKVKKLHPDAILPTYGSKGAACFDLYALPFDDDGDPLPNSFCYTNTFGTGLAFEIPDGYVMLVYSRSGHGFKHDVRLSNCVGVIDSDYRGELKIKLSRDCDSEGNVTESSDWFEVKAGDRIAQAMIAPVNQVTFEEVDELKETERGANGFGSTGA